MCVSLLPFASNLTLKLNLTQEKPFGFSSAVSVFFQQMALMYRVSRARSGCGSCSVSKIDYLNTLQKNLLSHNLNNYSTFKYTEN